MIERLGVVYSGSWPLPTCPSCHEVIRPDITTQRDGDCWHIRLPCQHCELVGVLDVSRPPPFRHRQQVRAHVRCCGSHMRTAAWRSGVVWSFTGYSGGKYTYLVTFAADGGRGHEYAFVLEDDIRESVEDTGDDGLLVDMW